jgi:hypothetical protein
VRFHRAHYGDVWLRDTGPIFVTRGHERAAACFHWNGWGGKYLMPGDDAVSTWVAGAAGVPAWPQGFVLEGGAVEVDGEGTILTTKQCLLGGSRNPGVDQAGADRAPRGVAGRRPRDLARSRAHKRSHRRPHRHAGAVRGAGRGGGDGADRTATPTARRSTGSSPTWRAATDARGRRLEVVTVPSPGEVQDATGAIMPASYMNFYIGNSTVVVPTYRAANDDAAVEAIAKLFPGRRTVGVDCYPILVGGGGFHCTTQQEPAPRASSRNTVTVAALQCDLTDDVDDQRRAGDDLIRAAAARGAQIILPSELFEGHYFCRDQAEDHFARARPVADHPTLAAMSELARSLGVVLPVSFFEKDGPEYYNSVAILDADGRSLGVYRKSHIPDGPGYQEKFFFKPGNTGFMAFATRFATIGVGICWDQWFPECARAMTWPAPTSCSIRPRSAPSPRSRTSTRAIAGSA